MKRMLLVAVAAVSTWSCGPDPTSCCLSRVTANFGWTGSYVADGGVTTQVQLIRATTGEIQLTLVRDGNSFTQTFEPLGR